MLTLFLFVGLAIAAKSLGFIKISGAAALTALLLSFSERFRTEGRKE
jgi:hypothetical protein